MRLNFGETIEGLDVSAGMTPSSAESLKRAAAAPSVSCPPMMWFGRRPRGATKRARLGGP